MSTLLWSRSFGLVVQLGRHNFCFDFLVGFLFLRLRIKAN